MKAINTKLDYQLSTNYLLQKWTTPTEYLSIWAFEMNILLNIFRCGNEKISVCKYGISSVSDSSLFCLCLQHAAIITVKENLLNSIYIITPIPLLLILSQHGTALSLTHTNTRKHTHGMTFFAFLTQTLTSHSWVKHKILWHGQAY